jgi:hypothetical protein
MKPAESRAKPGDAAGSEDTTTGTESGTTAAGSADESLGPPGIDAINPDYSIENLLLLLGIGGLGGASPALARALIRLGITRSAGVDTHHIVAQSARRADAARKLLERFGIDLEDPSNGAFLPEAQHDHLHTNEYYNAVNRELAAATTKSEAQQILRSIARRLAEGSFP